MDESATLQERASATSAGLSRSELRVAEFMVANPRRVAVSSAAELAQLIGTSDATVVRTATSLGYRGFKDLRKSLMGTSSLTAADILEERIDGAEDNLLPVAIDATVALLGELRSPRVTAGWRKAVALLRNSQRIWPMGFGPAAAPAEFLALSLQRIGRQARPVTMTGFRLADDLLQMGDGDVVVVFAPVRLFKEIDATLDHARSVGASTVVISEALGLAVRGRADVAIGTPDTTDSSASELVAAFVLAHTFVLELARDDEAAAVGKLQELNRVRSRIVGGPLEAI